MPIRSRFPSVARSLAALVLLVGASASAAPPVRPSGGAAPTTPTTTPTTTPSPTPTTPTPPETEPPETEPDGETPPETEPTPPALPAPSGPDEAAVAKLQEDARALRDELFKARARVSIVGSKLFTARIAMSFRSNLERFYTAKDFTIRVDGAPVYVQENGLPKTAGDLFEVFAAPGSHELAISVDLVARRDPSYKLEVQETLSLVVPEDARVSSRLVLRENGNMWRFAEKRRGRTDLRVRLQAKAKVPRGNRKPATAGSISAGGATK
ncbi:MAG TPA: hypothetical protein VFG69_13505 [Nannocystaceae bacterium]|nr:hypothetical protein [Nannocystaceae bacterium]